MRRGRATVVHVCEPGAWVALKAGHLVARRSEETLLSHPLGWTGMLCCHHRSITVSGPAIAACMAEEVPVAWFAGNGRLVARVSPPWGNDVERRRRQTALTGDDRACLAIGRKLAIAKATAQVRVLRKRLHNAGLPSRGLAALLAQAQRRLAAAGEANALRGHEGRLAHLYFRAQARCLAKVGIAFPARQRPADGLVNAGLNLLYTQLTWRLDAMLQAAGYDPGLGAVHRHNPASTAAWGRPALACDLIEPLRPVLVDAFLFPAIGRRRFTEADVEPDSHLGHRFTGPALAAILTGFERHWSGERGWERLAAILAHWRDWVTAHAEGGQEALEAVLQTTDAAHLAEPEEPCHAP